jgi:acetylornithine deacetylase/succinyl-diaminopimelate desuccinylase-like protein
VPGRTTAELVAELQAAIGDAIEVRVLGERRAVESPPHTPMFGIIKEVVEQRDNTCRVVPTMVAGSCDALAWRQVAVPAFGFVPVQSDEQVDFGKSWQRGTVVLSQVVARRAMETFAEVVVRFLVEG